LVEEQNNDNFSGNNHHKCRIGVVGAGLAGLACANVMAQHGYTSIVLDKGRRSGGRVATRQVAGFSFDHGAQYFTTEDELRDSVFKNALDEGVIAQWSGALASIDGDISQQVDASRRRWVGVPYMNSLPAHMSSGLSVKLGVRICELKRQDNLWHFVSSEGSTVAIADIAVIAVPAPQAVDLLSGSPRLAARVAQAGLQPCWAIMVAYDHAVSAPFDGAFVQGEPLSWICRNGSKPGRGTENAWVLHASPSWSEEHLEADGRFVSEELLKVFANLTGIKARTPAYLATHRWRYALADKTLCEPCVFDDELQIGACGDWCLGGKIEAALQSGQALAKRIIAFAGTQADE